MPSTETQPTQACRVSVRGVHKSYRQGSRSVQALRGVDLQIEGPGFHAIMGPSGSGKSTLLYLLAGLDTADAGEIRVGDVSLANLSEADLSGASLIKADLSGVLWDDKTKWPDNAAFKDAKNIPPDLKNQLGLD
jgi:predicted ABC-type transport system involved in lysophospholipase L1 biosynthesis ATPase subunit